MKKILHITNWYPNKWNKLEALFIKEQFDVFSKVCQESKLIHIEVRNSTKHIIKFHKIDYSDYETGYYIFTKIKKQFFIDILTTLLLMYALFKEKVKKYDVLHFHIAYPLLSFYRYWKKLINKPIIISEHWSAYHFNFYMPKESKKLNRIKNIFKNNFYLVVVSQSLLKDIQNFADIKFKKYKIIPNVINKRYFFYRKKRNSDIPTFFIINNWRPIKNPFSMLEGFNLLHNEGEDFKLYIGGYGELIDEMKSFVKKNNLEDKIEFTGKLTKKEIGEYNRLADAYLFSSKYETFSVVCAEALCCGTPIIGPQIEAIEEYANSSEYIKLNKDTPQEWAKKIKYFIENRKMFDNEKIANKFNKYFSLENIKKLYKELLDEF